jgi:hypothetical protein
MTVVKQALVAILAATWIVGLYYQGSWLMAGAYVAISAAMVGLMFGFGGRRLKHAPRRDHRRRK